MILHTVLPDYVIMPEEDEVDESLKNLRYVEFGGRRLLVEPSSTDGYKIVRLFSTDPQDYLNVRFQPGNIIPMRPQSDG
ncbi:MAG TPA: YlzJ-like family protein [Bacillales bacterium]|nr:YlzJ-like family protein [Bacillales bacterium]